MKRLFYFLVFVFTLARLHAQEDTVSLAKANLSDAYLVYAETGQKTVLSDSIIKRNGASLTSVLNFNSLVFLKENGAGMVSSASFRGTTAAQTAVVWNGININPVMIGQMDFNAVNPFAYDNLVVRAGGGSFAYGSGAIGGSIHLNNELKFNQGAESNLFSSYGSFNTYNTNFKSVWSDDKFSFSFNAGRSGSENDYPFPDSDQKNLNGEFYNNNLSVSAAYKIDSKNILKFYGNMFDGERHFSLISENALPTKYHDYNTRSMIEWNSKINRFSSDFKLAYLGDEFRYFPNIHSNNYEYGDGDRWMAIYDLRYSYRKLLVNLILDYDYSQVKASSIPFAKRSIGSAGLVVKHGILKNLLYELSVRQEISDNYTIPFLYSFGLNWNPAKFYTLGFNVSKNFRLPTFNDLFWPGSGNPDLKSEISQQYELRNQFVFGNLDLSLNAFHNSVTNLIQWIPMGSISIPENVGEVKIFGIETLANYHLKFNHHRLDINASYAYTSSQNQKLKKQLIYVPYHMGTASMSYGFKRFSAYYQLMYNGEVYTDSKNESTLNAYLISNLGAEYNFGKKQNFLLGAQLRNLFDQNYQNVLNRPMPGKNYNVYLNLKF